MNDHIFVMARRYKKRSYKKKRTTRRTRYPRYKAIKAVVRRAIDKNLEVKCAQYYNDGKFLQAVASASFPDNVIELGVDGVNITVPQGTGQGNRIGNRVRTKRLRFKGTLIPLPYSVVSNTTPKPIQMKCWIFYDKTDPVAVPDPRTNFFQNGNSVRAIQGQLTDFWAPINTERYAVLATKTFKLGFSLSATTAAPSSAIPAAAQPNNDFKLNCNFSFDLTKHYPKIVRFADGSNTPTTRGLFALFVYAPADGTQVVADQIMVGLEYMLDYKFTDA